MSDGILKEADFFLHCVLSGILLIFLYDVIRVFRRVAGHSLFFIALEDFCYWVFCGFSLFLMLYRENDGMVRGYAIGAVAVGMLLYSGTVSPFLVRWASFVLIRVLGWIGKTARVLSKPFCWFLGKLGNNTRKAGRLLSRLGKHFKRTIGKWARAIKVGLKKK